MHQDKVLSVTELSRLISQTLDYEIPFFKVEGDFANNQSSSGHYYFLLKMKIAP